MVLHASLKKQFDRYINPQNAFLFIAIATLIQITYLFLLKNIDSPDTKGLFFLYGDAYQYVKYCENFYQYGTYFEGSINAIVSYSNRMPGMCILYVPIRLFFSQQMTLNIFVIIQAILSAVASYFLGLTALKLTKNKCIFYICYFLYAINLYTANYNHRLYTESLTLSILIFAFYSFIRFIETKKTRSLLLFSFLFIWSIFLRPFLAPILIIPSIIILFLIQKRILTFKHLIVFISPIILIWGLWTLRNYQKIKLFIPLQSGSNWYDSDIVTSSRTTLIRTYGLSWGWWSEYSEHTWFMPDNTILLFHTKRPSDSIFFKSGISKQLFSNGLTIDSLKEARRFDWYSRNPNLSDSQRCIFAHKATKLYLKFVKNAKINHPIDYYFFNRLRLLLRMLNQPHLASVNSFRYPFNVVITFFDGLINYFVFYIGSISLCFLFLYRFLRQQEFILLFIIPIYILLLFSFVLRIGELRFFTLAYPFLLLHGVIGVYKIKQFRFSWIIITAIGIWLSYLSYQTVLTFIKW